MYYDNFGFDGGFFGGMPPFFAVFFVIVLGLILMVFLRAIFHSVKNKRSPMLTVPACVVCKRQNTWGGSGNSSAHTSYYATFEVESGDRMELEVDGDQIGYLAEGYSGKLTFRGTEFISFERN